MARPKNKKSRLWLLISLLAFAGACGAVWWLYIREAPQFIRYPEFGIELPSNYSIHGIDVSRYQQFIDWEEVKDMQVGDVHIGFAFIKATEGLGNVDRYFIRNWHKAQDASVVRGAYHYFLAPKSGKQQALNFINAVELEKGDLPPVLDIEQAYGTSGDLLRKNVKEYLETVEQYYHITPVIYTNVDFYNRYLKDDFDGYRLWVAHYLQRDHPRITRNWMFWQHSEQGRVNGILRKVDFNVFNGDSTDFREVLVH